MHPLRLSALCSALLHASAAAVDAAAAGAAAASAQLTAHLSSPWRQALPPPAASADGGAALRACLTVPSGAARRFLVFEYGAEQEVNGFAALFQWKATALALAGRYGRTLVELAPPPPPRAGSREGGGSTGERLSAARAELLREPSLLLAALAAANDPWQRAPLRACGGAKAGCFLEPPTGCGLAWLPRTTARALHRLDEANNGSSSSAAAAAEEEPPLDEVEAAAALPLLDVAAEEQRLARGGGGSGGGGGADDAADALVVRVDLMARYSEAALFVTAGLAPPGGGGLAPPGGGGGGGGDASAAAALQAALGAACAGQAADSLYCRASTDSLTSAHRGGGGAHAAVAAWQRLWLPAHEALVFRPRRHVRAAAAASAPAPAAAGAPRVGVHYRAGDAARLPSRSHAPLREYIRQALCAAGGAGGAGSGAADWQLFLASDSASARRALAANVAAAATRAAFEASVAPSGGGGGEAACARAGAPAEVVASAAAVFVITAAAASGEDAADAHHHVESWIRAQQLQLSAAAPRAGGSRDDAEAEADAAYLRHIARTTAPLPQPLPLPPPQRQPQLVSAHLRVFAVAREDYAINGAALDEARAALRAAAALPRGPELAALCPALRALALDVAARSDAAADGSGEEEAAVAEACAVDGGGAPPLPHAPPSAASLAAAAVASVTAGVVADIHSLAQSAALVGTCLSQVSRLAYDLSYAAGAARREPLALDARRCAAAPHQHAILAEWRGALGGGSGSGGDGDSDGEQNM